MFRHLSSGLAILLASAALTGTAIAAPLSPSLDSVVNAPLLSDDPAKPIEVIAARWWLVTDKASAEMKASLEPDHQMQSGSSVELGTFTVDESKGPVSLVVDYGALQQTFSGGTGGIQIGIECLDRPMLCAVPMDKTVLVFNGNLLAKVPLELDGTAVPFVVGRESHVYRLPAGEPVRIDLELGTATELEPLLIKAWLIYGSNAADVVPGQTSMSNFIWLLIGGGLIALVLIWRRLNS